VCVACAWKDLQEIVENDTCGQLAAFYHETIQGVGGAVELAEGYLPAAYDIVRRNGGVCVADEVQGGFARLGSHFWSFESHGVTPDIVTMAKGIANGFPMAAVVTTPEIARTVAQRLHLNTFGGNPVACAAARAVLEVIEEEGLQQNALEVGSYLKQQLHGLARKHSLIGHVRGQGLMLGVELVRDRSTKEPATSECAEALEMIKDMGVLIGKGGRHGSVFRIKPPLCFTKDDADCLVNAIDLALARV